MLHFARGIAFRVNVGNFLQLERAFERDRIVNAASEIKKIRVAEKLSRKIFVKSGSIRLQNRFDLVRNRVNSCNSVFGRVAGERATHFAEMQRRAGAAR